MIKKTIGVDVLYGYSKNEETLPAEWSTTTYDNIATEGGILWVKCLARYVDGSVEEMITSHYVASDKNIDANNNNNEDLYTITMTIIDCGEIYNSGDMEPNIVPHSQYLQGL